MAQLVDILADIRTAVEALPSLPTEYDGSDWLDELASITPDTDVYQIRHQHQQEVIRSNVNYQTAAIEIRIMHHLLDAEAATERTYTRGAMIKAQEALLDRNWWNAASAGIYQLVPNSRPELEQDVTRQGNVVSWSVLSQIEIIPE
jgi:hypothetical protein